MTDRECLLIAYGALKVEHNPVNKIIEDHLFGDKPNQEAVPAQNAITMPEQHVVSVFSSTPIIEPEKAATPGEYRLKRSGLGAPGTMLKDQNSRILRLGIENYETKIAKGTIVHPHLQEDIEATKLFLDNMTGSKI